MSNQKRSNSTRKSTASKRPAPATSYSAEQRRKSVNRKKKSHKQHMPRQNKMIMLVCLAILCVGLIFPEVIPQIIGSTATRLVKFVAIFGIILAIAMTRYRMTITDGFSWLYEKVINPYDDWDDDDFEDEEDDEDYEDDDDEDEEEEEEEEELPKPIRSRKPRPVVDDEEDDETEEEEAPQQEFTQEDYELFMKFMAFRNAANQQPEAGKQKKTKK